MKICFLNSLYSPDIAGGAEIILKAQVDGLRRAGHDVFAVALGSNSKQKNDFIDEVKVYRVPLANIYFPFDRFTHGRIAKFIWHWLDKSNAGMARRLLKIIKVEKPDVVVTHNLAGWSVAVWRAISGLNTPIVHVMHDQYLLCARSTRYRSGSRCAGICKDCSVLRTGHKTASLQVQHVVGVSNFVLDRHTREFGYFSNIPQTVIKNAREISPAPPKPEYKGAIRFGYLGGLAAYKGVTLLINEFLKNASSESTLQIAGSGTSEFVEELVESVSGDKRIKVLGYTTPQEFFSSIDVLIVPSLWDDTLPGVVFESLQFGKPVIGSLRGGIPEMLRAVPGCVLFDPDEIGALGKAIVDAERSIESLRALTPTIVIASAEYRDENAWIERWEIVLKQVFESSKTKKALQR